VEQEDLAWLTHPDVVEAKVKFSQACMKLKVFSDAQHEVERLFQRLASWTEFKGLFVHIMGLAHARAEAASNSAELLGEVQRSSETLQLKFRGMQKVAARVAAEMQAAKEVAPSCDAPQPAAKAARVAAEPAGGRVEQSSESASRRCFACGTQTLSPIKVFPDCPHIACTFGCYHQVADHWIAIKHELQCLDRTEDAMRRVQKEVHTQDDV
jgi:hypothetical protein